jgi:hypothetical protein
VVFGASQGYFAAIKGLLTNGATNTVGDISFATRNAVTDSTLTNRLYIQAGGNVGIGTASPQTPLHVIAPEGGPGSGNAVYGLLVTAGAGNRAVNIGTNGTAGWIQSAYTNNIGVGNILALNPNGGNVSIGTTNSSAPLHIRGIVAGGINAYNYYNYTFPQAGVYTVILEWGQFSDTNIIDGWNVTVGNGNNPTIYKISGNGAYLRTNVVSQYVVGFGSANSLPGGYNSSNYNLRIALLCAQ